MRVCFAEEWWTRKARARRGRRVWIVARPLIKTDRMRLIVLVGDVQASVRQPAQVGANSTGPIVVIDWSVSVLAVGGELRVFFAKERWTRKRVCEEE